jgi:transposase
VPLPGEIQTCHETFFGVNVLHYNMKLSTVFENLVLTKAQEAAPAHRTGRPRPLSDSQVTALLFKLLRTGCQWRELDCGNASFMGVYRRLQLWERNNVTEHAYQRALETYSKLRPPKRHLIDSSHVKARASNMVWMGRAAAPSIEWHGRVPGCPADWAPAPPPIAAGALPGPASTARRPRGVS